MTANTADDYLSEWGALATVVEQRLISLHQHTTMTTAVG